MNIDLEIKTAIQETIEYKYSKKRVREMIRGTLYDEILGDSKLLTDIHLLTETITRLINTETHWEGKQLRMNVLRRKCLPVDLATELLVCIVPYPEPILIQACIGQLEGTMPHTDKWDRIRAAADIIFECAAVTELYTLSHLEIDEEYRKNEFDTGVRLHIQTNWIIDEDVQKYIGNTKYLPPMLCKPVPLIDNYDSAYLTVENDHVVLGSLSKHDLPLNLEILDTLNNVELCLCEDVLELGEEVPEIDPAKLEQLSHAQIDTHRKTQEKLLKESSDIYASLLANDNSFYLTWKFDTRGRVYSQGYHVQFQSYEAKKAMINIKQKHDLNQVIT